MGKRGKGFKKKPKVEIVFDPQSRKEFLTGFSKRKNERRKRAKEQLERLLKEEKKRIRQEVKDGVRHLKKSYEPIPEVEELLKEEEFEDEQVTVKVVELSTSELAAQQNWIGQNKPKYSDDESGEDEEEAPTANEEIPGMSVTPVIKEKPKKQEKLEKDKKPITSKRDLDKLMKKKTVRSIEKSKFFKMKQQCDKLANRKKARRERNQQSRELKKVGRKVPKKGQRGKKADFSFKNRRKRR